MADWTNKGVPEGPRRSAVRGEERHDVDETGCFDSEGCARLLSKEEVLEDEDSGCGYSENNEEAENEKTVPKGRKYGQMGRRADGQTEEQRDEQMDG